MVEEEYIVSTVKAIGFQDPNKPESVIDNEPSTRWAHQGVGSWIQLDLGEEKTPVRSVGITWFKGNERTYNFIIQTSTNEINFQDVITDGKSGSTTTDLERYDFPTDTTARFVRVVVNGNSANDWASIHTSKVFSEPSVVIRGTRGGGGGGELELDEHGIRKIYKDSTRPDVSPPFIMGLGNWRQRIEQWDGNFEGSGLDTVFTSTNDEKQRMNVFANASKPEVPKDANKLDRRKLMSRADSDNVKRGGWMAEPNDWRDYEVTAVEFFPTNVKDNGSPAKDTSAWYGRGAKHTGETLDSGSQGSAYKPDLLYAGNGQGWKTLKETLHFDPFKNSSSETIREKGDGHTNVLLSQNAGNVKGRWIGIKTVVYNKPKKTRPDGSEYWPVMMEMYICNCDSNGNPDNNWELKYQCEDDPEIHGRWSKLPNEQPGPETHTISWGGPIITCRTDRQSGTGGGYPGMKFKKVSIREIEPGVKF
jgi:hypothetical protein